MGRRIDAVLVSGGILFVIEFKVGKEAFGRAALDLKNFHEASHALQQRCVYDGLLTLTLSS